ncbi:MAG: holo-ACP synthase [Alphaproteobacteria bacterium]|nr:holo-ACP synthase [Alphaproteobacteria bacterium]OJV45519.1 MAG: holo-[acyl-carrier-protein] synthase [Alphaproteobacteria bacterium 43-37]
MLKGIYNQIISIGFDVTEVERIEKSIERFKNRFLKRCFTEAEVQLALRQRRPSASFAKRFAAKEALVKALKTGFTEKVFFQDIEVLKNTRGDVDIHLKEGALAALMSLIPTGFKPKIHLSLSDDSSRAYAWVIIVAEERL